LSADALRRGIIDHLRYSIGRPASTLTSLDLGRKVTRHLSAEFLHIVDDLADAPVENLAERFALQLNDTHP
jgi:hypothetical protein